MAEELVPGRSKADRYRHHDCGIWLAHWNAGVPSAKSGLYEIRTDLTGHRIARVLFYIDKQGRMVLLYGFIKKTQKTPVQDLQLAESNKKKHERGMR